MLNLDTDGEASMTVLSHLDCDVHVQVTSTGDAQTRPRLNQSPAMAQAVRLPQLNQLSAMAQPVISHGSTSHQPWLNQSATIA